MRSVVLPGDDDVPEEDGGPGRRPAIDETVSLVSDATGNARYGSLRSLDGGGQGDVFVARCRQVLETVNRAGFAPVRLTAWGHERYVVSLVI